MVSAADVQPHMHGGEMMTHTTPMDAGVFGL